MCELKKIHFIYILKDREKKILRKGKGGGGEFYRNCGAASVGSITR